MSHFLTVFRIVLLRAVANWRLLSTVAVGILFAAGLMGSVSLYSDTVRDLGLRHALEDEDPFLLDVRVYSSSQRLNPTEFAFVSDTVDRVTEREAGGIVSESARAIRSATFFSTAPGDPVDEENQERPRAHFQSMEHLLEHVTITDGQAPRAETARVDPPVVEVLVSAEVAARDGIGPGSELDLHPFWNLEIRPVRAIVSGVFTVNDPAERYWAQNASRYDGSGNSWPTYPLFVLDEEVLTGVVARYLPTIDGTLEWLGLVEIGRINSRNARDVEARLRALDSTLSAEVPRTTVRSDLAETIGDYRTRLFFTRLPLFALMLQVVGIVLYYLVMVATMLQERQTGEIALLRSRGASSLQVVTMSAIEGALLCGLAVVLGPFLASFGISVLGLTPSFRDLSGGELLDVPITRGAFLMAGLGAGLAFVAILVPAFQAARKTMVDYKTSLARPQEQPVFLRYYLDLVLIAAAAFAFYQLRQRGSLVTERLFGDLSADPLLLISPTLFMLMVALVFVRLFPLALRLVARIVSGMPGPTAALGTWRMVRSPLHYSRLILLLLLATAVGMFAAGFRATLEESYDDRASYQAAAPTRLTDIRAPIGLPADVLTSTVKSATGAETVSPVVRLTGTYNLTFFQSLYAEVLGLEAGAADLLYWRGDFGSSSPAEILARLAREDGFEEARGPAVPGGMRMIGAWVYLPLSSQITQPWVRLRDGRGNFWDYRLFGPNEPGSWQFFVADLLRPSGPRVSNPPAGATLDAVYIRVAGTPPAFPQKLSALFDDIQVSPAELTSETFQKLAGGAFPDGIVVESFDGEERYELITGASAVGEPGAISRATGKEGAYAARIAFTRQVGTPVVVGLRVRTGETVLPVAADQDFLEAAKLERGDEVDIYVNRQYVRVKIVDSFRLFPSYDPESNLHLVIADLAALTSLGARVPFVGDEITPAEVWLALPAGAEPLQREALAARGLNASEILDQAALRAAAASDPLVAASWEGILFLSFASVLALTALGFAVYAILAARARSLEFAILRTMGYSSRQVLGLVSFEQLFVIVSGIAVGTALGFPLGRLMIGYLGVTETGRDPLPPIASHVSWATVITVYALLAAVFVATVAALARVYSRVAVARALRIGEI